MTSQVSLSNITCWELWARNDADLLRAIASRRDDLLPSEEWRTIEEHLSFLRTDESYRDYFSTAPACDLSPRYLEWEYQALIGSTRWQFITNRLIPELGIHFSPERMLDLGTWTGAHAVDLSNRFPEAEVYAREIVTAMKPAIEWTTQAYAKKPENVTIEMGDHLVPPLPRELDFVFSGEVFEHVRNPETFIRVIEGACRPGAWVVLTTPIEPPDYDPDRVHVHVRHLEEEDLREMFGHRRNFGLQVIPPRWIVTWYQITSLIGAINYERKMRKWGIEV